MPSEYTISSEKDPVYAVLGRDPIMKDLLDHRSIDSFAVQDSLYHELSAAIVYQQISVKAADAVYQRFRDLVGWDYTPAMVSLLDTDALRSCGLSRQKASYMLNIADYFTEESNIEEQIDKLSDEEVITKLTTIKGVGIWTVKMVMMFYLQRPDIFPYEDLAIAQVMQALYQTSDDKKQGKTEMLAVAEQWRPYRSTAAFYLWAWKRWQWTLAKEKKNQSQ